MTKSEKIISAAKQTASESAPEGSYSYLAIVEARLEIELEKAYDEIDRLHGVLVNEIKTIAEAIKKEGIHNG